VSKANKRERQRQNREAARVARMQAEKRAKQRRLAVRFGIPLVLIAALLIWLNNSGSGNKTAWPHSFTSSPKTTIDAKKTYAATMVTSEGTVEANLDVKKSPIGVNNFVFLARNHFYDGLTFHRAAKDFVIQGGDPKGDGSSGPGYSLQAEVPTDAYKIGDLAYAKTGADPAGTAGSQFFVITGKNGASLPKDYAYFGHVTKGLAVAQKIESYAPPSGDGTPIKKVTIKTLTVTENGKVLQPTVSKVAPSSTTTSTAPSSTPTSAVVNSSTSVPIVSGATTSSTAVSASSTPATTTPATTSPPTTVAATASTTTTAAASTTTKKP